PHTATTHTPTLSLHDALPISGPAGEPAGRRLTAARRLPPRIPRADFAIRPHRLLDARGAARLLRYRGGDPGAVACAEPVRDPDRSEEHTSELQSRENLVCRLL